MKSVLLAILAIAGLSCADVIPEWVTLAGQHYHEVTVVGIQPDAISIRHQDGVAKIPFDNLTEEQRKTYQLTSEGRASYLKELREQYRVIAEAARGAVDTAAGEGVDNQEPVAETPAPVASSVKYVTAAQIKRHWALTAPVPHILDKNYKELIRNRNEFLASIARGDRDREAERKAAEYNKALALKTGDQNRVEAEEAILARLDREEAEIAQRNREDERQRQILAAIEGASTPPAPTVVVETPAESPPPYCPPPVTVVCPPSPPRPAPVYHPPPVVVSPPPVVIPPSFPTPRYKEH